VKTSGGGFGDEPFTEGNTDNVASGSHLVVEISREEHSFYVGSAYFQVLEPTELYVEKLEASVLELFGKDWFV